MQRSPGAHAVSLLCFGVLGVCSLGAQSAEVTSKDASLVFRSGTNLVPVPVVVRDSGGHAVGNLSIEDFQLFDNGKPQMISKFSVEKIAQPASVSASATPKPAVPSPAAAGSTLADANPDGIPDRFVAYLFDDLHMSLSDLVYTRDAAKRQIDSSMGPLSRAAIYTTSGQKMQEFTGAREKLHAALDGISAGQAMSAKALEDSSCPPVDYYMADRIYNKHDLTAWKIATKDAMYCGNLGSTDASDPTSDIQESQVSQCEVSGSSDGVCMGVKLAKEASRAMVLAGDREGDRNRNDITVITGLFDNDGNFVSGAQQIVEMRLLDETLDKRLGSGIAVKNSFTVHPGRYVVRLVVRDSEGQLMSAQSSLVEIP